MSKNFDSPIEIGFCGAIPDPVPNQTGEMSDEQDCGRCGAPLHACLCPYQKPAAVPEAKLSAPPTEPYEEEDADCEGCNRDDCKGCAYNEAHPPPDFVTKAGTRIFVKPVTEEPK